MSWIYGSCFLNIQRDHFMPVVRSFYVISGCTSFKDLCIASMALQMYIAAYFVNMFGMFLSRLSLFSLLFIFSSVSSLIYTVLCELRLIKQLLLTHCYDL